MYCGEVMKLFKELLLEGKHDRGIFKALLIIGGPAAGKTTFSKMLMNRIPSVKIKLFDSDVIYELLAKKHGIDISSDNRISSIARAISADKHILQSSLWVNGMLPLIVLGVPSRMQKISARAELLKSYGYDVEIIFIKSVDVEHSIEQATRRMQKTGRGVPLNLITRMHNEQDDIIEQLKTKYDVLVINDFSHRDKADDEIIINAVSRFFNAPVKNPIGRHALSKLTGSKSTLSDIGQSVEQIRSKWKTNQNGPTA